MNWLQKTLSRAGLGSKPSYDSDDEEEEAVEEPQLHAQFGEQQQSQNPFGNIKADPWGSSPFGVGAQAASNANPFASPAPAPAISSNPFDTPFPTGQDPFKTLPPAETAPKPAPAPAAPAPAVQAPRPEPAPVSGKQTRKLSKAEQKKQKKEQKESKKQAKKKAKKQVDPYSPKKKKK